MEQPQEQTLGAFIREFRREIAAYLEARLELTRLATYEKTAGLASATIFFIVILGLATITVLLFSIALSIYFGKLLGDAYLGFAAVALIYLLLAILMFLFKKQISNSIHSATLEILMKSDAAKEDQSHES